MQSIEKWNRANQNIEKVKKINNDTGITNIHKHKINTEIGHTKYMLAHQVDKLKNIKFNMYKEYPPTQKSLDKTQTKT